MDTPEMKTPDTNVMQHQYRVLTDEDKQHMQQIKDVGLAFHSLCEDIGMCGAPDSDIGSRELSLAKTKIEEAVMWAVKHLTK